MPALYLLPGRPGFRDPHKLVGLHYPPQVFVFGQQMFVVVGHLSLYFFE
jgi:hypothetical protein